MSVVPGFKYDLFISYAHQNDRPWRWVTEFIQTLKAELEGKSRDFTIWWDPGLRTGENFDIAIANAIAESAVFLSVLSLAYGDSIYCKQEVEAFRHQRHSAFTMTVGSMSRMQAIVIEREFTRDRWAPEFRSTSPQLFFNEHSSLFSKPPGLTSSDPWIQGLWKVRDSIWAVLCDMRCTTDRMANYERLPAVLTPPVTRPPSVPVAHKAKISTPRQLPQELYRPVVGHLATFIGPIAKVVVNRIAKECVDIDQIYHEAAKQIENDAERKKFLRTRPR